MKISAHEDSQLVTVINVYGAEDLADTGEMDPASRAYFMSNIFDIPDELYQRWKDAQEELAKMESEIWRLKAEAEEPTRD